MKRSKFALVTAALVLALAGMAFAGCQQSGDNSSATTDGVQVTVTIESATDVVTIDQQSVTVTVPADATVYDATLAAFPDAVDAEDTEYGKYVHSIAGYADGSNYGWTYLVNGEMAADGCSAHTVAAGDTYTWQMISW